MHPLLNQQQLTTCYTKINQDYITILTLIEQIEQAIAQNEGGKQTISALFKLAGIALQQQEYCNDSKYKKCFTTTQQQKHQELVNQFTTEIKEYLILSHNSSWEKICIQLHNFATIWLNSYAQVFN